MSSEKGTMSVILSVFEGVKGRNWTNSQQKYGSHIFLDQPAFSKHLDLLEIQFDKFFY